MPVHDVDFSRLDSPLGSSTTALTPEAAGDIWLRSGEPVLPYLPPLLQDGRPNYHHHLHVRPALGEAEAVVRFDRYAWVGSRSSDAWVLREIEPLEVVAHGPTPFLVVGPHRLNPECPQAWALRDPGSASVVIGAVPRRPDLPTLQLLPGLAPPEDGSPHLMTLPPRIDLPEMRHILPCRLEVFPLTPRASIAVRFRMCERGESRGFTPFLFHSTLKAPRAWEIQGGRHILELEPNTGAMRELVEGTPESGQLAPALNVFDGRVLATFAWRSSPRAPCFSVAGLIPDTSGMPRTRPGLDF